MSTMVEEALGLAVQQQNTKPSLSILVGYSDEPFGEVLGDFIQSRYKNNYAVRVLRFTLAVDLLREAMKQPFNLSIVSLNNLVLPAHNMPSSTRIDRVVKLVGAMKAAFKRPIIVHDGCCEDASMAERIKAMGGDAYLRNPFKKEDLSRAVDQCISSKQESSSYDANALVTWFASFKNDAHK